MIYAMLASATLTFLMLGIAQRLPDPYWNILLHLHEAPLAIFVFCTVGLVMRTFETTESVRFRGRMVPLTTKKRLAWKSMAGLLFAVVAVSYRFTTLKAFAAWHNTGWERINPWDHRGNVFAITLGLISLVIAMANLKATNQRDQLIAYLTAVCGLLSFSPLLMQWGFAPYHPFSIGLLVLIAAASIGISNQIKKRLGWL